MPGVVMRAIERLRVAGVRLGPGLSDSSVSQVQDDLEFTFGPEHREFLQSVTPEGPGWPDWRNGSREDLRRRLNQPIEGVLFDVHHNGFWPASWGERPNESRDRERVARRLLDDVPKLVPVYSHRFLTSDPALAPSPVFSIHQTDVISYGDNLLDYVSREFSIPPRHSPATRTHIAFWSDLASGAENRDL